MAVVFSAGRKRGSAVGERRVLTIAVLGGGDDNGGGGGGGGHGDAPSVHVKFGQKQYNIPTVCFRLN